jgi:hypothetical protein
MKINYLWPYNSAYNSKCSAYLRLRQAKSKRWIAPIQGGLLSAWAGANEFAAYGIGVVEDVVELVHVFDRALAWSVVERLQIGVKSVDRLFSVVEHADHAPDIVVGAAG